MLLWPSFKPGPVLNRVTYKPINFSSKLCFNNPDLPNILLKCFFFHVGKKWLGLTVA